MSGQKTEVVTEETLSKAIDSLIAEHFSKSDDGKKEPELKQEGAEANGGKDVIKAKKSDDADADDEAEKAKKAAMKKAQEDKEKEEAEKAKKSDDKDADDKKEMKKSFEEQGAELESLRKSFAAEQKKNEDLSKSIASLNKSVEEKFETIGEIFKGLKYEIDTLKKSPLPRKTVSNVGALNKSFNNVGDEGEGNPPAPEAFKKSEVCDAIETLVKSGSISSSVMTEFELQGKISQPHQAKMVAAEILKSRSTKK